jgi:hypothetical protein
VWTKEVIYFKRLDDNKVIDYILFSEIDHIISSLDPSKLPSKQNSFLDSASDPPHPNQSVNGIMSSKNLWSDANSQKNSKTFSFSTDSARPAYSKKNTFRGNASDGRMEWRDMSLSDPSVIQIKTKTEGFNSGRTYCLRISSECDYHIIAKDLVKKAELAKEKEESKSMIQKYQHKVRRIFESQAFQGLACCLILMVT